MADKNPTLCLETAIHHEVVERVWNNIPGSEQVQDMADVFKVLADPTRLQLVLALARSELCVCDLTALTEVSGSAISHQLRVLRNMRLVKYRKEGKMVFYSLDDRHVQNLLDDAFKHVTE